MKEFRSLSDNELTVARQSIRVLVLTGLGLNCEVETAEAFRLVGAQPERVHLLELLEGNEERQLSDYQIMRLRLRRSSGCRLGVRQQDPLAPV